MMKKILCLVFAACMILAFAACGSKTAEPNRELNVAASFSRMNANSSANFSSTLWKITRCP